MNTQLRDIPEFPNYKAGSDGTIWTSHTKGRVPLGTAQCVDGVWLYPIRQCKIPVKCRPDLHYLYVRIKHESGAMKNRLVHRLILETFVGPCPEGMQCRHFPDANKTNNRLENLQWGTPTENAADREVHGTVTRKHPNRPRGANQWKAKLTEELVKQLRVDYIADPSRGWQTRLGKKYNISATQAMFVVTRKSWAHVE
jgi:hypothetical protein